MEWTKIPVDLLQSGKNDKEILSITKYQLLWAMLERQPDDKISLRYMTKKQLQQARDFSTAIARQVDADIKSTIKHRGRQKIYYEKKQGLIQNADGQTDGQTDGADKNRIDIYPPIIPPKGDCGCEKDEIISCWNALAKKYEMSLIKDLNESRLKKFKQRYEQSDAKTIQEFFDLIKTAVRDSLFLQGKQQVRDGEDWVFVDREWRADFDFFMQQKSFTKAIEGAYDDPDIKRQKGKGERNVEQN